MPRVASREEIALRWGDEEQQHYSLRQSGTIRGAFGWDDPAKAHQYAEQYLDSLAIRYGKEIEDEEAQLAEQARQAQQKTRNMKQKDLSQKSRKSNKASGMLNQNRQTLLTGTLGVPELASGGVKTLLGG